MEIGRLWQLFCAHVLQKSELHRRLSGASQTHILILKLVNIILLIFTCHFVPPHSQKFSDGLYSA